MAGAAMQEQTPGVQLRIRVIGTFTPAPAGRIFSVTPTTFADVLERTDLRLSVAVPDRLGSLSQRTFEIGFPRLRAFQLAEVVAATPLLAALAKLAEEIGGATPPPEATVLARVRTLVRDGALSSAVAAAMTPRREDAGDDASTIAPKPASSSALDAVVRGVRSAARAAPTPARAARAAIEQAVFATAADVLQAPDVATLESAWRGLKLLVAECPPSSKISVEVVDVAPEAVADVIATAARDRSFEQPDLFVVVHGSDDIAMLKRLAAAAEAALAPVLVGMPADWSVHATRALATLDGGEAALGERWSELRREDASRWLAVVTNRVVVATEGVGAARRVSFSNGAFAVAAMLARSFRDTGGLARVFGRAGALEAPAACEISTGRNAGASIPTEAFLSVDAQQQLASWGTIGLGSGRDSNQMMLATAPMVNASADAMSLPAQIWSGRIVRFSTWVRDQLPVDATPDLIATLFDEAAEAFLFGHTGGRGVLRTGVTANTDGTRAVEVAAALGAELASIPFELAFTLALRG